MAHVIEHVSGSKFYTIDYDENLGWNSNTVFPGGMRILGIEIVPGAADAAVIIRDQAGGGVIFNYLASADDDIEHRQFRGVENGHLGPLLCRPHINHGEVSGSLEITFQLA